MEVCMRLIFIFLLIIQFVSGLVIGVSAFFTESPGNLTNFGIGLTMVTTSLFMFGGLFR